MFYVRDENGNLIEALDKEGVFAVLEQAIEEGTLENIVKDSAFVSKLKCCVSGQTNKVAFVSQAKYNELEAGGLLETNALYFITDDTTCEDIELLVGENTTRLQDHETRIGTSEGKIATNETAINEIGQNLNQLIGDLQDGTNKPLYSQKAETTSFTNNAWQSAELNESNGYKLTLGTTWLEDLQGLNKPCLFTFTPSDTKTKITFGIIVPPDIATSSSQTKTAISPIQYDKGESCTYRIKIVASYCSSGTSIIRTWNKYEVSLLNHLDNQYQREGTLKWKPIE